MVLVLYYDIMKFLLLRYFADFKKYIEEKGLIIPFILTIHDCFLPSLTSLFKKQIECKSLSLDIDIWTVSTQGVFSLPWDESGW